MSLEKEPNTNFKYRILFFKIKMKFKVNMIKSARFKAKSEEWKKFVESESLPPIAKPLLNYFFFQTDTYSSIFQKNTIDLKCQFKICQSNILI